MDINDLYAAIDEIGTTRVDGLFYRHTGPHRDPLSGIGARITGGRWNPAGTETLYLAQPLSTCEAEFRRMAQGQGEGPTSFLPRSVHTIAVTGLAAVDLTASGALLAVGLTPQSLTGPWEPCQRIGDVVDTLGIAGLLAPSATGQGAVLSVYIRHAHNGELTVVRTDEANADGSFGTPRPPADQ